MHTDGQTVPAAVPADGLAAAPADAPRAEPHEEKVDAQSLPKVRLWAVVLALAAAGGAFWKLHSMGVAPRQERDAALREEAASYDPRPLVDVVKPVRAKAAFDLRLPADMAPMQTTAVAARANGYLRALHADVGDRVTAGTVLAEIDTPEVDAQIVQAHATADLARANVAKAKVDLDLATATFKRYEGFASTGGVTAQQLDEKRFAVEQTKSDLASSEAAVVVAEADIKRLTTLQGFERVAAPFDGVVTARGYDVGALVGSAAAQPLFRLAQVDVLKVFVDVPQTYVSAIREGDPAFLSVRNWPGREFAGKVVRTTGVLDATTRTLRLEIDVSNTDGALYAGMFGEVRIPITTAHPPLMVPTSAAQFGAAGSIVWIADGNKARARKVTLGRDFGAEIEVADGLADGDLVVRNPGERLADGVELRIAAPKAPPEGGAPASKDAGAR
jgi:RND family efflux transporter MFP subunit